MRFFNFLLPVLFVLGTGIQTFAQHAWCGVSIADQELLKEQMFKNRKEVGEIAHTRGAITYVKVQPQVVRETDGTGGASISTVLESICVMNDFYNQIDVHFYLHEQGIKYINSTQAYTNPSANAGFLRQRKVPNAMNIYYVADIPGGQVGTTQAFYNIPFDYVVCDNQYALIPNVLSHEVGHFFTLPHPFNGWDAEVWDASVHGNPVGDNSPGGVPNEKMDGSNCQTAGDGICDTPPDYLFAFHPSQIGCTEWNGGAMDPDSVLIDPMETNLMSYFEPCNTYELTEGQKTEVLRDLNSSRRSGMSSGIPAFTAPVTETIPLITPAADVTVDGYENVNFVWNSVPNAEWYLLQVDRSLFDFNSDFMEIALVKDTVAVIALTGRRSWKYRVKAYNAAYPCSEFSEVITFRTGENPTTSIPTIDELNDWQVIPNPVRMGQNFNLQVNAAEAFDATIRIYDLVGKQVFNRPQSFGMGNTSTDVSIADLAQGMYIIQLESQQGIATQKLIVNK